MADLSEVETALLSIINNAVYPNGTSQPSVASVDVRIYRGWPISTQLDADLGAGKCHVSVYSQPNVERNTTRYRREQQVATAPVHTLTAAVSGNVITLGGTVAIPQNVVVLCSRQAFIYAVQANDDLASIATAVAALIAASFPGTASSGPDVTVAGSPGIIRARIASQGTIWTEQRRQERGLQIGCWCPTPALRDVLAPAIDLAFAQIDWLTMPDGGAARIRYERTVETDSAEKVQLFRRDLFYSVEYATATITNAYEVGAVELSEQSGVRCKHEFEEVATVAENY